MSFLYYTKKNFIALPGRTVQTFPSGLVRVERSFACRRDDANIARNIIKVGNPMPEDDGAPAIDGLYVFPEPQEIDRGDGFIEFRVTAYGRTGVEAPIEISTVRGTLEISFGGTPPQITPVNAIFENYVLRKVFQSNQSIESLLSPPDIIPQAYIGGRVYRTGTYDVTRFTKYEYDIRMFLRECTTSNFGIWSEYTISYQSFGSARFILSLAR